MKDTPRWVRNSKTVVLIALVVGSLSLSYMMWHGDWQTPAEVGLTQVAAFPPSTTPKISDVTAPYEIVNTAFRPAGTSVSVPGSSAYMNWTLLIANMHVQSLHPVTVQDTPNMANTFQVEFDFGTDVDHANLVKWIPSLGGSTPVIHGSEITLYQATVGGPVMMLVQSRTERYIGQTDLSGLTVQSNCEENVKSSPWTTWNSQDGGYVPSQSMSVSESTWTTTQQPILPFVHAFFVDPEVLTRIQENQHTVLWTDGSRAVQWDDAGNTVTYQDPNAAQSTSYEPPLQTAIGFIQTHGGAPANLIAFANTDIQTDQTVSAFTTIPYVDGFPILGKNTSYDIQVRQGHTIVYRRPLWVLVKPVHRQAVQTITAVHLRAVIRRLIPSTPMSSLTFQLGYRVVPVATNQITLTPVYYVSQSGLLLWTLDAQTGKVVAGVKQS